MKEMNVDDEPVHIWTRDYAPSAISCKEKTSERRTRSQYTRDRYYNIMPDHKYTVFVGENCRRRDGETFVILVRTEANKLFSTIKLSEFTVIDKIILRHGALKLKVSDKL